MKYYLKGKYHNDDNYQSDKLDIIEIHDELGKIRSEHEWYFHHKIRNGVFSDIGSDYVDLYSINIIPTHK